MARSRVPAKLYAIEFQKRGLPRSRVICISAGAAAPRTTGDYDVIAIASIPGREGDPCLWRTVTTSMTHDPFGTPNPKIPRMVDGVCRKVTPEDSETMRPTSMGVQNTKDMMTAGRS